MSSKAELKQAKQLIAKLQYQDALEVLDLVLEYEEDNVPAMLMKGVCQQRLKQYDASMATLTALLKLEPENILALRAVASIYTAQNKTADLFEVSMQALYLMAREAESKRGSGTSKEVDTIMSQAYDVYSKLRSQIKINDQAMFDRLLELQIDLPDELITEPNIKRRNAVHDLLSSMNPPILWGDVLPQLIRLRTKQLEKTKRILQNRQKNTLNFTEKRAAAEMEKALADSMLVGLLRLHISTEEEDEPRRSSESALLDLLTAELKDCARNVGTARSPSSSAPLDRFHQLQRDVRDLAETMAMFDPVRPLALELAWDYDNTNHEDVIKEWMAQPEHKGSKKGGQKQSKRRQDEKSEKNGINKSKHSKESDNKPVVTSQEGHENMKGMTEDLGEPIAVKPTGRFVHFARKFPDSSLAGVFSFYDPSVSSHTTRLKGVVSYHGDSVLGWRLAAYAFSHVKHYQESIDAAHSGLRAIEIRDRVYGMRHLNQHKWFFQLILAQAYTFYQAPKNWELALTNYNHILQHDSREKTDSIMRESDEKGIETGPQDQEQFEAVLGKGSLLAKMGKNDEALELLEKAISIDPHNSQALSDLSWLYVQRGDRDQGIDGLKRSISIKNTVMANAEINWRIGYAIWSFPRSDEERETCYEYFVKAIEYSSNYAPAYTYLGLFYDELVGDKERAQRCFYTALEYDSGEILAGEKLAQDFAANRQWDLVEVVANTVLSSSRSKSERNLDWPYRALGIARLNQLRHADAVKYFQRCLRSANQDVLAWIGLGEAYIYSGRYRSAEKALTRALKLQPKNFSGWYVLSLAQREMMQFPQSATSLQNAIKYSPEFSVALQWAMADNCLRAAAYLSSQSFLRDALKELNTACAAIFIAFQMASDGSGDSKELSVFFGTAAEVFLQFDGLGYHHFKDLPDDLFDTKALAEQFRELMFSKFESNNNFLQLAVNFSTEFVARSADDMKPRRVSAHSIAALCLQRCDDIEAAAEHFKAAIQLEPRNEDMWTAYGVCLSRKNPEVAQHCFIRALSLNGRNAETWVNLGALYLVVKDYDLALEAVDHALSLDAEYPRAWIAQALAEQALGARTNDHLYRTLMYAYNLSENDELASFALALKEYETRPEIPSPAALGALEKLMALRSDNRIAKLILGLLLERQGSYEASLFHLKPLEAWPHVARVQMASKEYEEALESCEKLLSTAHDGQQVSAVDRLSALLVSGLSHFYLQNLDSAIESFTEALDIANDSHEDVLRLLVEVLCSSQDADAQQVAQDQLFDSIGENGATLQVTLLLGALGFINKDETVIQAAQEELENLITPELKGAQLAQACHILNLLDPTNRSFQRAVFQWPTDYDLWRRVNHKQALILAEGQTNNPSQLSRALVEAGGMEDRGSRHERVTNFQRAVFYQPANESAWTALASSLATN